MGRIVRRLLALAALVWAGVAAPSALAASPAPGAADPSRQILVFLRLPPQHYRPGSAYGGGYGDAEGRVARMRVAGRLAQTHGVALVSEWPMPSLGVDCFVMAAPEGLSADEAAARLAQEPDVAWSQPIHIFTGESAAAAAPNDPLFRVQPAAREWRLADLHQISTGRRVRVAVIDSLVDRNHPDLAGQIEYAEDFVPGRRTGPESHGTGVAGVIAARANNALGIAGIAPDARILALRACWEEPGGRTLCDSLSLARALDAAVGRDAQVVNMSLSGPPDLLVGKLIDIALGRGISVVAAYDPTRPGGGFPASHPGVVAVSDRAPARDAAGVLEAPGRDIPTAQPGGRWFLVNGSSYAAAHVSGLFALLRAREGRSHSPAAPMVVRAGAAIDACATLLQRSGPCDCGCSRPKGVLAAFAD